LPQGIVPFVFSREYNLHSDILSTTVIFCTIISFLITVAHYVLFEVYGSCSSLRLFDSSITPLIKMINDGSSSLESIWKTHLAFAQSREGEPVHISRNAKSFMLDFFSFKRMMYVRPKRGGHECSTKGKPLSKRGSF
jgi:hypothetical protein